jgi:hypothetical protein
MTTTSSLMLLHTPARVAGRSAKERHRKLAIPPFGARSSDWSRPVGWKSRAKGVRPVIRWPARRSCAPICRLPTIGGLLSPTTPSSSMPMCRTGLSICLRLTVSGCRRPDSQWAGCSRLAPMRDAFSSSFWSIFLGRHPALRAIPTTSSRPSDSSVLVRQRPARIAKNL